MKNKLSRVVLPVFAATLFTGCFLGIKREVVIDLTPREYKPLVTTNTIAVFYGEGARLFNTPARREFRDFIDNAGRQFQEGMKEAADEAVAAELVKSLDENPATILKDMTGLEEADIKWTLAGLENFKFDLGDLEALEEKGFDFPRFYAVVHTAKPLDIDAVAENYAAFIEKSFAEEGAEGTNALAKVKEFVKVEKVDYNGASAYKLRVESDEFMKYVHGFSPIVTVVGNGGLMLMATSEELLGEIDGLYSGEVPAASEDSPIMKEIQIPDDVVARFAFPGVGDFVRSALTDEIRGSLAEDPLAGAVLKDLVAFRYDSGALPDSPVLFERFAVDFASETTAADISASITEAWNVVAGFVQIGLADRPDLAFVTKLLQGIQIASSGKTCVLAFTVKLEDFQGVDFVALGKKAVELFTLGEETNDFIEGIPDECIPDDSSSMW